MKSEQDNSLGLSPSDVLRTTQQVGGFHYCNKTIQPWYAMESWMTHDEFKGYLRGNVIKYLARCNDKGGVEDLKKARHYLDKLLEFIGES